MQSNTDSPFASGGTPVVPDDGTVQMFTDEAEPGTSELNAVQRTVPAGSTLNESVWQTLRRDLLQIALNLRIVLVPVSKQTTARRALREWDLWGPMIFSVSLALLLSHQSGESTNEPRHLALPLLTANSFSLLAPFGRLPREGFLYRLLRAHSGGRGAHAQRYSSRRQNRLPSSLLPPGLLHFPPPDRGDADVLRQDQGGEAPGDAPGGGLGELGSSSFCLGLRVPKEENTGGVPTDDDVSFPLVGRSAGVSVKGDTTRRAKIK